MSPEVGGKCPRCNYLGLDGDECGVWCPSCETEWTTDGDQITPDEEPEEEN